MSNKVSICSLFDKDYIEGLNDLVTKTRDRMHPFYLELRDLNSKIVDHIATLDKAESTTFLERETVIPWTHKLYQLRLELIDHIKNIIYFSEMRMMPFRIDDGSVNKTTEIVNSIISLLNSHIVSLSEINEYQNLEPSANKMTSSSNFFSESDLIGMNKNLQREKFYRLSQYTKRYGYILQNLQKAIFTVSKIPDKYRDNIEKFTDGMFL